MRLSHLLLLLMLAMIGCSREKPVDIKKAEPIHLYTVRFAVAKIPDTVLAQHGGANNGTNGFRFDPLEARNRFAAYVLDHTNEFSVTTTSGNCVPILYTHHQTNIRLIPDPKREEEDLEQYGFQITRLSARAEVQKEDSQGKVRCSAPFDFSIHLSEPQGGSADQGGGGFDAVGYMYKPGTAEMRPLTSVKGTTLWALFELDKEH